ncbi:hypothetical protein B0H14DRAFT_2563930 [Mycena olivaceomarginata]|nr:hypothetical protein B0H14DRAFT_2563930 [Mycena olivaceomarginata]
MVPAWKASCGQAGCVAGIVGWKPANPQLRPGVTPAADHRSSQVGPTCGHFGGVLELRRAQHVWNEAASKWPRPSTYIMMDANRPTSGLTNLTTLYNNLNFDLVAKTSHIDVGHLCGTAWGEPEGQKNLAAGMGKIIGFRTIVCYAVLNVCGASQRGDGSHGSSIFSVGFLTQWTNLWDVSYLYSEPHAGEWEALSWKKSFVIRTPLYLWVSSRLSYSELKSPEGIENAGRVFTTNQSLKSERAGESRSDPYADTNGSKTPQCPITTRTQTPKKRAMSDRQCGHKIPAQKTRKPWITRTPTYRSDGFHHGVLELDALVMKLRNDEQTRNNGKTAAHKCVRGEWKDVPLPFIGASKDDDLKIPRTMIDSEWLWANPDSEY